MFAKYFAGNKGLLPNFISNIKSCVRYIFESFFASLKKSACEAMKNECPSMKQVYNTFY